MALLAYCTTDDIADRLSEAGRDLHTEDAPPTTLGNVIQRASADIDLHLALHYDPADMAGNDIIKHWASVLSAFYLTTRLGNSAPQSLYEQAMEIKDPDEGLLARVAQGKINIPGMSRLHQAVPRMSNIHVRTKPYIKTVVEKSRSSTDAKNPDLYKQRTDRTDIDQYLGDGI